MRAPTVQTYSTKEDRHSSTTMSTTSEEECAAEQAERNRRSASPSPEARQNSFRDRKELFPFLQKELFPTSPQELLPMSPKELFPNSPKELFATSTKELFPVTKELFLHRSQERFPYERVQETLSTPKEDLFPETKATKELFPQQTQKLYPDERVPHTSPTVKKDLFPEMKTTMAHQTELIQAARQELEVSAPGCQKQQPREAHRRQTHSNQNNSTKKEESDQKEASGSRGRWSQDISRGNIPSIDSTPYFERRNAARPYKSTASPPQTLHLDQLSTNPPYGTNKLSNSTSSRMKEPGVQTKFNITPARNSSRKLELPKSRDAICRDKTQRSAYDDLSTPTVTRYTSLEPAVQTGSSHFSSPENQRLSSPKPQTPQTSSPTPTSTPHRRPETNDLVARRMISSALGVRLPKRVDDRSIEIAKEMRAKRTSNENGDRRASGNMGKAKNDENTRAVEKGVEAKKEKNSKPSWNAEEARKKWDEDDEVSGWW